MCEPEVEVIVVNKIKLRSMWKSNKTEGWNSVIKVDLTLHGAPQYFDSF
jgi:hypothetical protein